MNFFARPLAVLGALVCCGLGSGPIAQGQISNTWSSAGQMIQGRTGAASVLLADGKILITGGTDSNGIPQASAEIFDPTTSAFSAAPAMNVPRANHAAILLSTGDVLVTGGLTTGAGYSDSAEIYSAASQRWSLLQASIGNGVANHAMSMLVDDNVLIAGGMTTSGPAVSLILFKPSDQSFTPIGSLIAARANAAAAATPDGRVLIVGGTDINGTILNSTEIFVYSADSMTGVISAGPNMSFPRTGATATTTYDGVAIIGGNNGSVDLGTAEIFSQWKNAFKVVNGGTPRSRHFAALLPKNGSVFAMGGSGGVAVDLLEPWANKAAGAFIAGTPAPGDRDHNGGFASPGVRGSLLVAGSEGASASIADLYWFPTVATDQPDYAPGTPVIMNGTGFQPNEAIQLHLHEWVNQSVVDTPDYSVPADATGSFSFIGYAPSTADFGARYHLTAVGQTSGLQAQTIFTDAGAANLTVTASPSAASGGGFNLSYTNNGGNLRNSSLTTPQNNVGTSAGSAFTISSIGSQNGCTWIQSSAGLSTTTTGGGSASVSGSTVTGTEANSQETLTVTLIFSGCTTATTVTSSLNPSAYGQPVTFTATVRSGGTPITSAAGETVTFKDGATVLGTGTLNGSGQATFTTTATQLSAGSHSITAVYGGDSSYSGSTSSTLSQNVNKATASVTVTPYNVAYDGQSHSATVTSITGVNGETGATVGTVTLNTTHTAAGNYTTDSWSFTGTANYNNIASTTITDTIGKAAATVVVTPYTVTYDGKAHSATVTSITGVNGETGATVGTVTLNTTHTNAGTYATDSWSFTGTANYSNIASTTITDTIGKAAATVVVTPYSVTYDGSAHTATVTSITGVNGETGATVGTVTLNTTHTNAGTYATDSWSFAGTANYSNIASTTITDIINKANATVVVTPYSVTYDGNAHIAAITSITGINGETGATVGTVNVSNTTHTAAGTYSSDSWSFTGTANYNNIAATTITDTINKANATVAVAPYALTYDGQAHTATITSISGVNGETGATVGAVNVSHTTHTNAGIYAADYWTFAGTANYNDIGNTTITDTINKLDASVTPNPASKTYGGAEPTLTGTLTGFLPTDNVAASYSRTAGESVTGSPYTISATLSPAGVLGNYNITYNTAGFTITPATLTLSVTGAGGVYNGAAYLASCSVSSGLVNGDHVDLALTYAPFAPPVNAGTYTASCSSSGNSNYQTAMAEGMIVITPASLTVSADNQSMTFGGSAPAITASYSGLQGTDTSSVVSGLTLTAYTDSTLAAPVTNFQTLKAGTYPIVASGASAANYMITYANGTLTVNKAPITGTVTITPADPNTVAYGQPATATVYLNSYSIGGVDVLKAHDDPNNPNNPNNPLPPSMTVYLVPVGGSPAQAIKFGTATAVPTYDNTINTTGTAKTGWATSITANAPPPGQYNAVVYGDDPGDDSLNSLNLADAGYFYVDNSDIAYPTLTSNQLHVVPATLTITANSTSKTYGQTVTFAGTEFSTSGLVNSDTVTSVTLTSAGAAAMAAVPGSPYDIVPSAAVGTGLSNYTIEYAKGTLTINQATATIKVTPYTVTYDGNAHTATATATGVASEDLGADVNLSGTTHTNAGAYSDSWSFHDPNGNYADANGTTSDTINKADASVVVTPYTVTYDGHAHTAAVTSITGVNGETGATVGTVDVSHTTNTNVGIYSSDYWTFTGTANYNNIGSTTVTDTINKADASVVVTPYTVTYDGHAHTAAVTSITGVNGETGATVGTVDVSHTTNTNAGIYSSDYWTFTGTANYNNIGNTTITDTINKADASVVVTPYTVTYDGHAHTAAVTSITGMNGEAGATVGTVNLTGTTHTTAGDYATDTWSFTGAANYNDIVATTIHDAIAKANAAVTVTPYSVTYDGNAHTATATITGVGTEAGATVGTVDLTGTTHTAAGDYATDTWSFTGAANYNDIVATTIHDVIARANASVTPNAASKTYGNADPTFTGTLTGFLPADSVTASYGRTAGETVAGGPYTISATLSPASVLSNYDITYNTANFTISKATASMTPNAASKTYGAADPTLTGTLSGFLAADNVAASYSRTAGETVAGSPYSISAMLSPAGVLDNYNITYNTANFTINKATASVTPNAASKTYGATDPMFTGTLTGFLAADNVTASYSRTTGETVAGGPYTISGTLSPAAVLGNYNITYNTASFTVNSKPLAITSENKSMILNGSMPTFTVSYSGFVNGENSSALGGALACSAGTNGQAIVGSPFTIACSGQTSTNYNIAYQNNGKLTVTYALLGSGCAGDVGHQILQPINANGTSVFNGKSTTPAKFRVCDAKGASIGTPGLVTQFVVAQVINGTVSDQNETVDSTTPDTTFRWDPTAQQWIFNISNKSFANSKTYGFLITLNDGSTIPFQYGIK